MAIEIGAYIAELLYEHEKVAVPGLGGFIKVYQHAVVDHVQEQIFPPTEEVKFNPNLAFDDGLLINKIVEDHGLSVEEAEKEIQGFVNELKEAADRREIIVLPGVGRLYRSGESQLNLLSDHQNFSTQLFGLAPAKALPVAKIEFIPTDSGISSSAGKKPAVMPWTVRLTTWANRHLWLVLGIAAVAILATAWILFREPESQLSSALNPPEDRLNVRPSIRRRLPSLSPGPAMRRKISNKLPAPRMMRTMTRKRLPWRPAKRNAASGSANSAVSPMSRSWWKSSTTPVLNRIPGRPAA